MSFYEGKTIAVAGGSGFIGTNLIAHLSKLGAKVKASIYDKKPMLNINGVEYISGLDLTNADCLTYYLESKIIIRKINYSFCHTEVAKIVFP